MKNTLFLFLLLFPISKINAQTTDGNYVVTDDNVKLFTKKSGTGPVCIFIHGGPGAWSKSFEDLGGSNLENHLTMVYYDQRGSGRSEDAKNEDYSLDRMLKDIEEIRIKYNADKVYLLAHSFGGILAANYALHYPSNVKGVILANCTLHLNYSIQNQINYMNGIMGTYYSAADSNSLLPALIQTRTEFDKKGLVYTLLSNSKKNIGLLHDIDGKNPSSFSFAQKSFAIADYLKDYTAITNAVTTPVLVITGQKDHAIGEEHYKSFHFPNQTIVKINGGHILYYEKNKKFVDTIVDFIGKTD